MNIKRQNWDHILILRQGDNLKSAKKDKLQKLSTEARPKNDVNYSNFRSLDFFYDFTEANYFSEFKKYQQLSGRWPTGR